MLLAHNENLEAPTGVESVWTWLAWKPTRPTQGCEPGTLPLSHGATSMVRVRGIEPLQVQGPTRSQVWPVCRFRHTRVSKNGDERGHACDSFSSPLPFLL